MWLSEALAQVWLDLPCRVLCPPEARGFMVICPNAFVSTRYGTSANCRSASTSVQGSLSWINRRLALIEKLTDQARDALRLGLLTPTQARIHAGAILSMLGSTAICSTVFFAGPVPGILAFSSPLKLDGNHPAVLAAKDLSGMARRK